MKAHTLFSPHLFSIEVGHSPSWPTRIARRGLFYFFSQRQRKTFFATIVVLSTLLPTPVFADMVIRYESGNQQNTLVELYTSEGCSSCPPADRYLTALKKRDDLWQRIIPIAFHVDYWDYIGWKDAFASPKYSNRQRRYQHTGNTNSVYTPQFVINGEEWRGFFARFFGRAEIPLNKNNVGRLSLNYFPDDHSFTAMFEGTSPLDTKQNYQLHVALLGMNLSSDVTRGENKGRNLQHNFVVLEHKTFNPAKVHSKGLMFNGPRLFSKQDKDNDQAVAVWLTIDSLNNKQAVLQAAGGLF